MLSNTSDYKLCKKTTASAKNLHNIEYNNRISIIIVDLTIESLVVVSRFNASDEDDDDDSNNVIINDDINIIIINDINSWW